MDQLAWTFRQHTDGSITLIVIRELCFKCLYIFWQITNFIYLIDWYIICALREVRTIGVRISTKDMERWNVLNLNSFDVIYLFLFSTSFMPCRRLKLTWERKCFHYWEGFLIFICWLNYCVHGAIINRWSKLYPSFPIWWVSVPYFIFCSLNIFLVHTCFWSPNCFYFDVHILGSLLCKRFQISYA